MAMAVHAQIPTHLRQTFGAIGDTGDAAFALSLDCQFLAWSARAQQLFGYPPGEVLGRYCYDVLAGRDEAGQCICCVNCPVVTAARFGCSAPPRLARMNASGNRSLWVRVSPVVLRAPPGRTPAVLMLAMDAGRYKRTEQIMQSIVACLMAGDQDGAPPPAPDLPDMPAILRRCLPDLTPREAEVLWQAFAGNDYRRMARSLNIQPTTVRNHLQHILVKVGVHSQRQAVLKATLALLSHPWTLNGDVARP